MLFLIIPIGYVVLFFTNKKIFAVSRGYYEKSRNFPGALTIGFFLTLLFMGAITWIAYFTLGLAYFLTFGDGSAPAGLLAAFSVLTSIVFYSMPISLVIQTILIASFKKKVAIASPVPEVRKGTGQWVVVSVLYSVCLLITILALLPQGSLDGQIQSWALKRHDPSICNYSNAVGFRYFSSRLPEIYTADCMQAVAVDQGDSGLCSMVMDTTHVILKGGQLMHTSPDICAGLIGGKGNNAPAESTLGDVGRAVLVALRDADYQKLQNLTSSAGISWNENPQLDFTKIDISKDEVSKIPSDTKKYIFGYTEGRGDPIELTRAEYIKKWIYDHDYVNATELAQNEILEKSGNNLVTLLDDAKGRPFIAYKFIDSSSVIDNWGTIYLFFDQEDSSYKLRGIAKNQWGI